MHWLPELPAWATQKSWRGLWSAAAKANTRPKKQIKSTLFAIPESKSLRKMKRSSLTFNGDFFSLSPWVMKMACVCCCGWNAGRRARVFICVQQQKTTKIQINIRRRSLSKERVSSCILAVPFKEKLCVAKCRMDAVLSSIVAMIVCGHIESEANFTRKKN